ncbi:MAG TPA: hypothetical protein VD902_03315, partial [Symbiobacteriaceae bacterium]|nr:hypothetical protein [Symbiobacteriaceae bacterium]
RPVFYYICIGKRLRGTGKCECAPIPMAELDAEIEQRVRERFGGAAAQETFLERITASHALERKLHEAELAELDRHLAELEEQAIKVRRDYRTDRISAEEYRDLKGEIDQEAVGLRERRQGLEAAIAECAEKERDGQLVREQLGRVDQWETLDASEKKRVLQFFIDSLVAYRSPGEQVIDIDVGWMTGATSRSGGGD